MATVVVELVEKFFIAIFFLICFAALGFFTLYLSRNIDYGEARFDSDGNVIRDEENKDE